MMPSYEDWISHCFARPVSDPAWYFDVDSPSWEAPSSTSLQFMTRLFTSSAHVCEQFTDAQLDQGFWYLVSPSGSDHMFALLDESLPEANRLTCLRAMNSLFQDLFAARCTDVASSRRQSGEGLSPLNSICHMWWEVIPIHGKPADSTRRTLDATVLEVLQSQLEISSIACQESALHGLGHWAHYYPERVEEIVAQFLESQNDNAKLRAYATAAAKGNVQ